MSYKHVFHLPVKIYEIGNVLFLASNYLDMVNLREKLNIDCEIIDVTENWNKTFKGSIVAKMEPIPIGDINSCGTNIVDLVKIVDFYEPNDDALFFGKLGDKEMGRGTNA